MRKVVFVFAFAILSCRRGASSQPSAGAPTTAANASSVSVVAGSGARAKDAAVDHQRIDVPAGKFVAGSTPGDEGRDPAAEPIAATYEMPAFSIDALPYPNEPGKPATTGVTETEAARLCEARGERLCSELEWERACRGPNDDPFSSGGSWDPTCTTSNECISGFGVRAMGGALEEWTASPFDGKGKVAVRGALASSSAAAHRCAARHALESHATSKMVGFRCCTGGGATPAIAAIEALPTYRKGAIDPVKLANVFGATAELSRVKAQPRLFKETEIAPVFERRHPPEGWTITSEPILWSPTPGEELLVFAGKSKGGAFVVAFHRLPGDELRLASSLVFANEQGPIALAYQPNVKKEIAWSTSWGALGEGGAISYRDDHRVVIVQR